MVLKKIRFEPIDIKEIELFTCSQKPAAGFFMQIGLRVKGTETGSLKTIKITNGGTQNEEELYEKICCRINGSCNDSCDGRLRRR